jgi:tetratricopeptide (TPR) repeat protein
MVRTLTMLLLGFVATRVHGADPARLFGTVRDESGQPVAKADVALEPIEGHGARVTATTNKMGNFLVDSIVPGDYRLRVAADGKAVLALEASAERVDKTVAWKIDGKIDPANPAKLAIADGLVVKCTATIGDAIEIDTAQGKILMSPQQALNDLARRAQSGDCAGALPSLERLTATSTVPKAHYLAGFCQAQLGATDKSIASLSRVLELQPKFPGAALLMGQVLSRAGKAPEAEEAWKKEIATAANPDIVVESWMALAFQYRDAGKDADAVSAFEQVIAVAPSRKEGYAGLATLYVKSHELEKAASLLDRARAAGVVDPSSLVELGIAFFAGKDYTRSAALLKQAIDAGASGQDLGTAYAVLGRCELREGKKADALTALKKSLELSPSGKLADETRKLVSELSR